MTTEIPIEYVYGAAKAAEWWAQYLPVADGKTLSGEDHLSHLLLNDPEGGSVPAEAIQQMVSSLDATFEETPLATGELAEQVKGSFISFLAGLILTVGNRSYDGSIEFGNISSYQPPDLVTHTLRMLGLDSLEDRFPAKVQTNIYGNGVIKVKKYSVNEFLWAGEGQGPQLLEDFVVPAERVMFGQEVMIKGREYVHFKIPQGTDYRTSITVWNQLEFREHTAESEGFLYANLSSILPDHLEDVLANPELLLTNPEIFTSSSFTSSDPGDSSHFIFPYFDAAAGERVPIYYSETGHVYMPSNEGFGLNDGNGIATEFAGPYRLVEVQVGELFMNEQNGMQLAEPGDYILLDEKSGRKKIMNHSVADSAGYTFFPVYDAEPDLNEPLSVF